MSQMTRFNLPFTYALGTSESAAPILSMEGVTHGSIETTQGQSITVYGSNRDNPSENTFVAAEDEDGTPVTMTIANATERALPTACSNYRFIKLVDGSGGTVYAYLKS